MKTVITFLAFLVCLHGISQTLTEEMGGIESNFEFYSGAQQLDVIKQILIERSTAKSDHSSYENQSYGYGYAYTDWRIEFVSKTMISSRDKNGFDERIHRGQYLLELKNKAGGVLLSQYIHKSKVREWAGNSGNEALYTYSIDLYGLPVVILDNVARIEIIMID